MDAQEIINAYIEKFGGVPMFLMGAPEEVILEKLAKAVEEGIELTPEDPNADY